ncbi:Bifunctional monothiol glutaredoxin-S16-chloroplastic [Striga hermonthica]|uniref:Bifunctional monothiol glutaredoxin-S16-chloroplastic n=1 Tax=Striga hermonthica TaxID=68872 RepID=A0A9N7NB32_STRHE|nr:Bifunctional monothiol glutaredoxin-S16-chloroplastic [Striga hermonthica]
MAAFTFSSALASLHSHRIFSNCSPSGNTFASSFYPRPYPAVISSSGRRSLRSPLNRRHPSVVVSALQNLSDSELVEVSSDCDGILPSGAGVYAVYDGDGELQFVGITRNLAASVLTHKKSVPDLCCSVKVAEVSDPNKNALTEAWKSWVQEHISSTGKVPPGNESGNSTWVKNAPPRKKADLRLTPGRHVQISVPLESLIDRLVKENKVVAFIKGSRGAPQCGFSQRVVAILESQGVDYESVDVLDEEHNGGVRETLKRYSNWPTFPQVFVNGELVGGCDILTSMYEKGELAGLFE